MASEEHDKPWEELEKLVERADADEVEAFLDALPPRETARVLSRLSEEDQARLLATIDPEDAADLIESMPDATAAEVIERLDPLEAAAIVRELASDDQADLLGDLEDEDAEAILAKLDPEEAIELRALREYADDVAGGLMITEMLSFPVESSVTQVIENLRANAEAYADYEVQYGYVTGESDELVGVLRMRDLLLARGWTPIKTLMIKSPVTVSDQSTLDELRELFEAHSFLGVPVINHVGHLIGVVQRDALDRALTERSGSDFQKSQGIVGGEELRSFPIFVRSRRRLAWLALNIPLNLAAASVISLYEETLIAVISLAVFLPIISGVSGNAGTQAMAVSMRELSLGLVRPADFILVWLKELIVGLINGLMLGLMLAIVAWLWKSSPALGLVVGGALAINTMVAVSLGGTLPLLLRKIRLDPALASGPILTTITDLVGFFLALAFAATAMPYLSR